VSLDGASQFETMSYEVPLELPLESFAPLFISTGVVLEKGIVVPLGAGG
jgi:hypothetical protein